MLPIIFGHLFQIDHVAVPSFAPPPLPDPIEPLGLFFLVAFSELDYLNYHMII
jgi:hypothetical protein